MTNKFTLYDTMAVLIPGIFFLWALKVIINNPTLDNYIDLSGNFVNATLLIVIGYIVGLLVQGLGYSITENIILKKLWGGMPSAIMLLKNNKTYTSEYKQKLAAKIQKYFNVQYDISSEDKTSKKDTLRQNQEVFYLCYRYIGKTSDMPQIFNSQYGLFRSLFTIFLLLSIIATINLITTCFNKTAIIYLSIAILCLVITYFRVTKRANDFAKCVYDLFMTQNEQNRGD